MAKTMISYVWFCVVVALIVSPAARGALDCRNVQFQLFPCIGYLINISPAPSPGCCSGAQNVAKLANSSKQNLRSACECLKSAARSFPNINFGNAKRIPALCHVNLNVTIDPNVDCTKLQMLRD